MATATQQEIKVRPVVNLATARKDVIKLMYSELLDKWFAPDNNPVSKAYYEYILDEDIVLHQQYFFGAWIKFVPIGTAIN